MEINEDTIELFTKEVKKFAHIDALIFEIKDQIKPLQERLKQLKLERKEIEKGLCPTMRINNFTRTELPNGGMIEFKIKQAIVPVTQKSVKEKMVLFFTEGPGSLISFNSNKPEDKGLMLYEYIYDKKNRSYTEKEQLIFKD